MPKIRNLFAGGNTCCGFYSFFDYMVSPTVERKVILKGGPGVGKSLFMKKMGADFLARGHDIEYHWCSSDNESLDGVVIGPQQVCILDGTAPHAVEPRFPGAVDEIINLGHFWRGQAIRENRPAIMDLTQSIRRCFERAYLRLRESKIAWEEWGSYYREARDNEAVNRNILALARDFVSSLDDNSQQNSRHLFAAAINPEGVTGKMDGLIDKGYALFAAKGNPGTGIEELFGYIRQTLELSAVKAEFYHNPLDPDSIDIIVLPSSKSVLLDASGYLFDYAASLPALKQRRFLDFDQLARKSVIDARERYIAAARERFYSGIRDAIGFIRQAKERHDELESYYSPTMDFDAVEAMRQELRQELLRSLEG